MTEAEALEDVQGHIVSARSRSWPRAAMHANGRRRATTVERVPMEHAPTTGANATAHTYGLKVRR